MTTAPYRYLYRGLLIFALPMFALLFSFQSVAEESQGRPWGRLGKPVVSEPPALKDSSGYLGRYNPWTKGTTSNSSDEPPRYRKRDKTHSTRSTGAYNTYGNTWAPASQGYSPYRSEYFPAPNGVYPYNGAYGRTLQEIAPWSGGLNPDYGNYWNDPYDSLQPDTGILWSDMWRR